MGKRIVVVLVVVVLLVAAAGGGFLYGKSVGASQASQARQQFARARFGQDGQAPAMEWTPQPGSQAGARAAGGTMGTIESIEGDTVVIETQQGTVRVRTTDTTLIQKLTSVSVKELVAGEQVVVSGSRNDDGSITARSIQSLRSFTGDQP